MSTVIQMKQNDAELTEVGIKGLETVDEKTFFAMGKQLASYEHGLQWAIGDWYNAIPWGDKEAACEEAGLKFNSAKKYGRIASEFKMDLRRSNLPFTHHHVILHEDLAKADRTKLLKRAADEKWSSARLKKERDIVLGMPTPQPHKEFKKEMNALEEAVASALPKTAGKRAINTAKAGIRKVASDMQHEFTKAVEKAAEDKARIQRENLKKAEAKAKEEFERTIKMQAGVKAFMSKEEFTLIRKCLHPDVNPHPKAAEAFAIFNRLADVKSW